MHIVFAPLFPNWHHLACGAEDELADGVFGDENAPANIVSAASTPVKGGLAAGAGGQRVCTGWGCGF